MGAPAIALPAHLPGSGQELLLKACLARDETALACWQAWRQGNAFDEIGFEAQRLLPLLHRKLHRLGVEDPILARYKGVHRHAWYQRQMEPPWLAAIVADFDGYGIETILLGEPVLSALYYPEPALCPTTDGGLLIPVDRLEAAADRLARLGWTVGVPNPPISIGRYGAVEDGLPFVDAAGRRLVLSWRVLMDHPRERGAAFWAGAQPLLHDGVPTRRLDHADLLMHLCQRGAQWRAVATVRWVADAWHVIQHGGVDWPRLLDQAAAQRAALPLRHALRYLRQAMDAAVPPDVLDRLDALPVSRGEAFDYRSRLRPHAQRSLATKALQHGRRWAAIAERQGHYGLRDYVQAVRNRPMSRRPPA